MAVRRSADRCLAAAARLTRRALLVGLLAALAGCGSALRWTPDYHVVESGETLYSIAWQYGLDQRQLAAWNRLEDGNLIFPGQRLRLVPPDGVRVASSDGDAAAGTARPAPRAAPPPAARGPARPVSGWRWPAAGPLTAGYGSSPKTRSGVHIGGRRGGAVAAAAPREVVYAGSGLKAYGQLVIIKHNASYLSAYGYNEVVLVTEGQRVDGGAVIARMGLGPDQRAMLHFEIRRDGRPVDPMQYLPPR